MTRSGALPALCLAALLVLTGCTGDRTTPNSPDPAKAAAALAGTKPGKAPSPADRCHESGSVPATKVVLTTADAVHLAGVEFGTGPHGVLLLPQRGADLCPWWDYATALMNQGFRVMAIDLRGTGYSESGTSTDYTADAQAGIAALKHDGATKVVLIGAALGAATALVTAGRTPDQVSGVVSLSYVDSDVTGGAGADPHTPKQAAARITAPMLLCFTAGDTQTAAAPEPQQLADAAHGPVKQLVGRPGVSHGWDMLKVGDDDVRPDLLAFLQSYA
jgi:pimeloyl-ACP methyl ester carboxylesterase